MKNKKIQWHPGFVAAMDLEFKDNRKDLIYEKEYNLNTKPLEIDLLVIKKEPGAYLKNEIGRLFHGHNIMEYKSPDDHLDIDTFYKTHAYACLYKAYGHKTDERKAGDITISIVREAKPLGLFQYFKNHNIKISNPYNGIYYVHDNILFPTQIVVTKELDSRNHTWLKALSGKMKEQSMSELLNKTVRISDKFDRELANSVVEISVAANEEIVKKLKEGDDMNQVLLEIMEPEIMEIKKKAEKDAMESGRKAGLEAGRNEGISGLVDILRDFGFSDDKIKEAIINKYNLSQKKAEQFL